MRGTVLTGAHPDGVVPDPARSSPCWLGLYITRELIEAHGGRITAESAPGGATTFRFTLPRAA